MKKPKGILLDIEGTTSSISFVHEVMFPFVRERLHAFLEENFQRDDVQAAASQIASDAGFDSLTAWSQQSSEDSATTLVEEHVYALMDQDAKKTGLKALQGIIWKDGFQNGQLKAHVYSDVIPCIKDWRDADIDVRIYSSGSIATQKLFFGNLDGFGDCLELFTGHYDTTIGGKKEEASYPRISKDWGIPTGGILFISDIADELTAAHAAGVQAVASIRPGNTPLSADFPLPKITSFEELRFAPE